MQIAEALRRLRTDRGLSQVGAAKRAGVPDFRTLSHWETDRVTDRPNPATHVRHNPATHKRPFRDLGDCLLISFLPRSR